MQNMAQSTNWKVSKGKSEATDHKLVNCTKTIEGCVMPVKGSWTSHRPLIPSYFIMKTYCLSQKLYQLIELRYLLYLTFVIFIFSCSK